MGTISPLLRHVAEGNPEEVKTVQELLPCANSQITLDVYTKAANSNKRRTEEGRKDDCVRRGQKVDEKYPQIRQ